MEKIYYMPPSEKVFNEIKQKAMELWEEKDIHPNYLKEKLDRIKHLDNVKDNAMYIISMFSYDNLIKLAGKLSTDARVAIHIRLVDWESIESIIFNS